MRLHRLDLLPPSVVAADGEEEGAAAARLPRPSSLKARPGGSLFSRAINRWVGGCGGRAGGSRCRSGRPDAGSQQACSPPPKK